jgi:hypothetical protein
LRRERLDDRPHAKKNDSGIMYQCLENAQTESHRRAARSAGEHESYRPMEPRNRITSRIEELAERLSERLRL